jgi:hypothetical protein
MSLRRIGFGFFSDLDFRLDLWFLFGLDWFLSDWIYQM